MNLVALSALVLIGMGQPVNVGRQVKVRPDPKHPNLATEQRLDAYWQRALTEVYRSPEELEAHRNRDLRRGNVLPIISRGDPREKVLALTFDDGPHPQYTQQLLAILKRENVKATFFVIGKMAELHPELVKAIAADHHEVGNHTFSHVTLTKIPFSEARVEYRACSDLLKSITGVAPIVCRPPGGDYDKEVVQAATDTGMTTTLWTDDPGDYLSPGTQVIENRTLAKLSNGGIVLLHDGIPETLTVLPQIIEYAKKHGYRFTTVSNLPMPYDRRSTKKAPAKR